MNTEEALQIFEKIVSSVEISLGKEDDLAKKERLAFEVIKKELSQETNFKDFPSCSLCPNFGIGGALEDR